MRLAEGLLRPEIDCRPPKFEPPLNANNDRNAPQQTEFLFDHQVGAGLHQGRNREADCFGGLEIDHQFEFGGIS